MVHNYFTFGKKIQVYISLKKKPLCITEGIEIMLTSWNVFQFWILAQGL